MGDALITAVLVYDEGGGAGMGHRARMEALAGALPDAGITARLAPASDRQETELIVVDSYETRADDRDRYSARLVVAVEDLGRDLAVDLLVDPSPPEGAATYTSAARVLLGPRFALLKIGAADARPVGAAADTVVVATGASDTAGVGARIAARLVELAPNARIRLVIGPAGSELLPDDVEAVRTTSGLAEVLADADVVITAAGVTLLEAMALGRPVVTFAIAPNQDRAARGAAAAGAAVLVDADTAAGAANALLADKMARAGLSRAAAAYVDRDGPARVAQAIAELATARASTP